MMIVALYSGCAGASRAATVGSRKPRTHRVQCRMRRATQSSFPRHKARPASGATCSHEDSRNRTTQRRSLGERF
ncbi:hypothetical protein BD309DRAFT_960976 [Dichomitus squalens]|nr:hypothetical protein BD309DRAFT_960976 [Dichomitus squalens]